MTEIVVDDMPDIPGLRFRKFSGSADYPDMLRVKVASDRFDKDQV